MQSTLTFVFTYYWCLWGELWGGKYEDGLGFQKTKTLCKLKVWIFSSNEVPVEQRFFFQDLPFQCATQNSLTLLQHLGCILGPFYFTRNGKTQGFYWDIDPLPDFVEVDVDPVDCNHQISGSFDDLGSLVRPNFGWVSFFPGEIEGFSVVSGESRGFLMNKTLLSDLFHFSHWHDWFRVKRPLKIPQHLPLTFRHFESLRLDCSPFRSEFVSAKFFAWGKDTRHRKLQVVVRDSRLVATLGTFEI